MAMDGSFIPPPFPFPEAWPCVFAEHQQRQERRWLTPTTFSAVPWPAPTAAEYHYPVDPSIPAATVNTQVERLEDDDDDSEYEYMYVLSDEWRERFQSSIQLQQLQQKRKKRKPELKKKKVRQQKQTVNAQAVAKASASRSGQLQREIEDAKTRELARKWMRRGGDSASSAAPSGRVVALETSLNALFDEFCDAFQPVVWPHDPL